MGAFDHLATRQRLAIFPLSGSVLFPGMHLPLHIFEARYKALVEAAMAGDRIIGMIQPNRTLPPRSNGSPQLFGTGCLGRISEIETLDDGRYNIVLDGIARFQLLRELDVTTPYRQIEAEVEGDEPIEALAPAERAALEQAARRFADAQGFVVDWEAVARVDDATLVNGAAQIAPFDPAAKQALLETTGLAKRAHLLMELMQFFGMRGRDDDTATLQ